MFLLLLCDISCILKMYKMYEIIHIFSASWEMDFNVNDFIYFVVVK
jgi:hypothetical protein